MTSQVYFIAAVGTDLVKIGFTTNVPGRLSALASASPAPLVLLATAPGGAKKEAELHEALWAHRSHGEWFRRCQMLDDLIAAADKPSEFERVARQADQYLQSYLDEIGVARPTRMNAPRPKPEYGWRDGHFTQLN